MKLAPNTTAAPSQRRLPNWLGAYTDYTAHTEAPREFHSWVAISTLAGAIGRRCWIDMGMFKLYPSFYTILVAPPGIATKSTTAAIGMNLLEESEAIPVFQGSITWQAMIDALADTAHVVEIGKKSLQMSELQVFASELGVLFDSNDMSMIDMLVDLWDGKEKFTRRTKGGGVIEVARPYVNFIACTTPSWLSSYAESYFIEGGFFSRTIFVYAEEKDRLIAYPDQSLDKGIQADLIHDLKAISELKGEFTLTDGAKTWGTKWYHDLYTNPPKNLEGEKFQSYISRRQTHLHKVAMVLSASASSDMIITEEVLMMAEHLLILAEKHLAKIHNNIVTSDKLQAYQLVVKMVKARKRVGKRELFRELSSKIIRDEFESAVQASIFSREIKQAVVDGEIILLEA